MSYLRREVADAVSMPSRMRSLLKFNFCQWGEAEESWIEKELWDQTLLREPVPYEELKDLKCTVGLDLSMSRDLTAAALTWKLPDGTLYSESYPFIPKDTIVEHIDSDKVQYDDWVEKGHVTAIPGNYVSLDYIASWFVKMNEKYNIYGLAYDPHRSYEMIESFSRIGFQAWNPDHEVHYTKGRGIVNKKGLRIYSHRQGSQKTDAGKRNAKGIMRNGLVDTVWMPGSIEKLGHLILDDNIKILQNPCLTWNVLSIITKHDYIGNETFDRDKSRGRIDCAVALAMSVGLMKAMPDNKSDALYKHGVRTLGPM